MSSLVDDLLRRGAGAADRALEKRGEEKLDDLVTKLEGLLPTAEEAANDARAATTRGMGLDGIHRLRKLEPQLVGLTRGALAVLVAYTASGKYSEAAGVYLRAKATPQELVGAVVQTADEAVAERDVREAVQKQLQEVGRYVVEEIGPVAARYLLPLLLQAK